MPQWLILLLAAALFIAAFTVGLGLLYALAEFVLPTPRRDH